MFSNWQKCTIEHKIYILNDLECLYSKRKRDINSCFALNMPVFKRIRIILMFTRRMDLATGLEGGNGNG